MLSGYLNKPLLVAIAIRSHAPLKSSFEKFSWLHYSLKIMAWLRIVIVIGSMSAYSKSFRLSSRYYLA